VICWQQGKWLYLEPIFSSEEIMKQIPKEGSAFRQMDATWRNIMAAVKLRPAIVEVLHLKPLLQPTFVEHLLLCCMPAPQV